MKSAIVVAIIMFTSIGCAGTTTHTYPPAPPAADTPLEKPPPFMQGLTAYVRPLARQTEKGENNPGAETLKVTVPKALRATLAEVGIDVVLNESLPHELTLTPSIDQYWVWTESRSAHATAELDIALGDKPVDAVECEVPSSRIPEFPQAAARCLVSRLGKSARLIAKFKDRSPPAIAAAPSTASAATASVPAAAPPSAAALATTAPPLVAGAPQPNAYAVVIGIERYSAGLPPPTGARDDAQRFADLARKSLGLSAGHVHLLVDDQATKGTLESEIEWLRSSVPPGGRVYFYFSGHGAPDASAGASYLVPFDGNPKFLPQTSLLLGDVVNRLGQSKAREVLAVFDSCFSGAGGRSVLPPGARPLVRVRETAPATQVAIFSASSGAESSGPAPGGGGGLFTQYIVQGLGTGAADIDGDGQVSLQELSDWTRPRVAREAKKENRDQTPSLVVGAGLGGASSFIVEWGLAAR